MRRHRRSASVRAAITGLALAAVPAGPALSEEAKSDALRGPWSGEYVCNQGRTAVTLTIGRRDPRDVRALFHFYAAPGNPGVPTGCFEMAGTYDPASGDLRLKGGRWLLRPGGYVAVDFVGRIDAGGTRFEGRVDGYNCSTFRLSRLGTARETPPQCLPDLVASAARE